MNFAVVSHTGGIVSNVIVSEDLETAESIVGPCVEITEATGPASIGYIWDGTTFSAPTTEQEPIE